MRALGVLVVACAAAIGAAGGTGRADARIAAFGTDQAIGLSHEPALRTAAVHPALHAITVRPGRLRGARASHASLPPVALASGWSLAPRRPGMAAPSLPVGHRRIDRSTRTGSARGPPIG
jgi:hypothetical protein